MDELSEEIRKQITPEDKKLQFFPRLWKHISEKDHDFKAIKNMIDAGGSEIELYITIPEVGGARFKLNVPGLGTLATTTQE